MRPHILLLILSALFHSNSGKDGVQTTRYLLYSVNPGEGFNLRRDVHMRAATLVNELRRIEENWVLVLPPWPHLYHWRSRFMQSGLMWEKFFDVESLSRYVPSIEYVDYLEKEGKVIDKVVHLQHFVEGWGEGGFVEKYEERPCIETPDYQQNRHRALQGAVFMSTPVVELRDFSCVSVLGYTKTLLPLVQKGTAKSVLIERMETVMHSDFGGLEYWNARSSMVYAQSLRKMGNQFMMSQLNFDPGPGNGRVPPSNGGGKFLSVHLRRRDFINARPGEVPSLTDAAQQINTLKAEQGLDNVFLSSDAPLDEKQKLSALVSGLVWYQPSDQELRDIGDGGVAIIDQWIAAHARFFVGSFESTFSFRIREDRQLMGFSIESTFNRLCGGSNPSSCERPSVWKIHHSLIKDHTSHLNDEL